MKDTLKLVCAATIHSADAKGSCLHRGIYVNLSYRVQYTRGREPPLPFGASTPPELRTVSDGLVASVRRFACSTSPRLRPGQGPSARPGRSVHLQATLGRPPRAVRGEAVAACSSWLEVWPRTPAPSAAAPLVSWLLLRTCGFLTFPWKGWCSCWQLSAGQFGGAEMDGRGDFSWLVGCRGRRLNLALLFLGSVATSLLISPVNWWTNTIRDLAKFGPLWADYSVLACLVGDSFFFGC
jgi:hypothetical protein